MGTGRIKKNTLRAKMLGILMLCAMTSLLAAGIVSYMALRMIQNDSIEDNMKMYLDQITRNTDGAYYDMLSIMNYMGPGGLVGNVTDSYLGATDNFDRFIEQRTLREEMAGLGYVNTKLVGVMYYDREEKKELISGMNVRALDGSHASLPEVVECAGNVIQAAHSSILGSGEEPVFSVMREVVFGNGKRLDVYAEIEADMKSTLIRVREFGKGEETIDVGKLSSDLKGHGGGDSGIVKDFLEMLLTGAQPNDRTTTLEHSMESHFIALAAEESRLHGGQVVDLEEFRART